MSASGKLLGADRMSGSGPVRAGRGQSPIADTSSSKMDLARARPRASALRLESTVRYLGIEVDDALELAEQTDT